MAHTTEIKSKGNTAMEHWKGVVVAESFDDPTIINRYEVERVLVSPLFEWPPFKGAKPVVGRWHLYCLRCAEEDLSRFQSHLHSGWYAHFWKDQKLTVLFSDARFDLSLKDRSTWRRAIAHGRRHDIPERQLDFKEI
jgi:hypothetical protein